MIKPVCDYCKQELKAFGGILFSPPSLGNTVRKYHVCVDCFEKVRPKP